MTSKNSKKVLLERGGDILSSAPTVDDVISLMKTAEAGIDKGPPELALEFTDVGKFNEPTKQQLMLMLAFHRTKSPKWIMHFCISKARGLSILLAKRSPTHDDFEVRACCGLVSKFRVECLLEDSAILRRAVEWFLKHHTACPELTWLEYDDCARDAENSVH